MYRLQHTFRLLTLALLLAPLQGGLSAQTWTATDWQGNPQDISEPINAGKAVFVDISAHWCGPCWNWHKGKSAEDLYHDFGPGGTDEFMTYFIDGDAGSNTSLLQGAGSSQGDWTEGTSYPIIGPNGQGSLVASNYEFQGYPTFFLHCGPGQATTIDLTETWLWTSRWDMWDFIMESCPSAFDSETDDATLIRPSRPDHRYCVDTESGTITVDAEVYNAGTNALASFTLEVRDTDGNLLHSEPVEGQSIAHGGRATFPLTFDGQPGEYRIRVTQPNGLTDPRPNGDEEIYDLTPMEVSYQSGDMITVAIDFDEYSDRISWELMGPSGLAASGSNYPFDSPSISEQVPAEEGCYQFRIYDDLGDGLCCISGGFGSYTVSLAGQTIAQGDEFGYEEVTAFQTASNTVDVVDRALLSSLRLYPNPVRDVAQLEFTLPEGAGEARLSIYNATGQRLRQRALGQTSGPQSEELSTADLAPGMYFVEIATAQGIASRRFSVVK